MKKIFQTIAPVLVLGVSGALVLALLFIFTYVLIWGLILGATLWSLAVLKRYLFQAKPVKAPTSVKKGTGRIIEHDSKK